MSKSPVKKNNPRVTLSKWHAGVMGHYKNYKGPGDYDSECFIEKVKDGEIEKPTEEAWDDFTKQFELILQYQQPPPKYSPAYGPYCSRMKQLGFDVDNQGIPQGAKVHSVDSPSTASGSAATGETSGGSTLSTKDLQQDSLFAIDTQLVHSLGLPSDSISLPRSLQGSATKRQLPTTMSTTTKRRKILFQDTKPSASATILFQDTKPSASATNPRSNETDATETTSNVSELLKKAAEADAELLMKAAEADAKDAKTKVAEADAKDAKTKVADAKDAKDAKTLDEKRSAIVNAALKRMMEGKSEGKSEPEGSAPASNQEEFNLKEFLVGMNDAIVSVSNRLSVLEQQQGGLKKEEKNGE